MSIRQPIIVGRNLFSVCILDQSYNPSVWCDLFWFFFNLPGLDRSRARPTARPSWQWPAPGWKSYIWNFQKLWARNLSKKMFLDSDKNTFRRDVGNHSLSMLGAERYQNQLCSTANAEMFKWEWFLNLLCNQIFRTTFTFYLFYFNMSFPLLCSIL